MMNMRMNTLTERLGTVICTDSGPSVTRFSFVVEAEEPSNTVKRGEFVGVHLDSATVIARIQDIIRLNRYFEHAEAVREYQSRGTPLRSIFPTDRWQYTVAEAGVLGFWMNDRPVRPFSAVSPGATVRRVDERVLAAFLRLDPERGLNLGRISHHDLQFTPSLERLLSKHLAVLAMSGAGKSYFISVLLEELLLRPREYGRIAVVVIDVHGEYTYLQDIDVGEQGRPGTEIEVEHIRGPHIQVSVPRLSADAMGALVAGMSAVQKRDLRRVLADIRKETKEYTLTVLIERVRADEQISRNTRDALVSWLVDLDETRLFGLEPVPDLQRVVRPGKLTLIDLSDFISLKKKQIVVAHIANELLTMRRRQRIPPFLLVLEEAHQFCPESRQELALPRARLETIAREGRKFYALLCLVSQRPVKLSTTILSQCSNQAIFRTTNPYDLDHIGKSSEGIDRASLDAITTLEVGEALFVGEAVSHPTFVKIRRRMFEPPDSSENLLDALRDADK